MDDSTFEERGSLKLSRMNLYILSSTLLVMLITIITSIIVFTPIREYIPGYSDVTLRRDLTFLKQKTDSLESIIESRGRYVQNIKNVIEGKVDTIEERVLTSTLSQYDTVRIAGISREDSILRAEIEREESYRVKDFKFDKNESVKKLNLFPPIKGFITSSFSLDKGHLGVDIVSPEDEPVKAVLDGYVIMASWNLETGYVVAIQHKKDLISIYKHNSRILKDEGDYIEAGDVVAIVGNSGELTTGPHLHFELWEKGIPLNPEDFVVF